MGLLNGSWSRGGWKAAHGDGRPCLSIVVGHGGERRQSCQPWTREAGDMQRKRCEFSFYFLGLRRGIILAVDL
jgi:hypothetical protein